MNLIKYSSICLALIFLLFSESTTSAQYILCGKKYIVKKGDTLNSIASRVGPRSGSINFEHIFEVNRGIISDAGMIKTGQEIFIPCAGGVEGAAVEDGGESETADCGIHGLRKDSAMADVSDELCRQFESNAHNPDHVETVIITLKRNTDRALMSNFDVSIISEMKNLPIFTGTLNAATLKELAEWDGVERIELDKADMRALDNGDS